MLNPDYLEHLSDNLVELYSKAEADILRDMARRIGTYDYYIPAAQWQHKKLKEMGMLEKDIMKELSKLTGKTQKEIKGLMNEAGAQALREDIKVYKAEKLNVPKISSIKSLQKKLSAGIKQTNGLFKNLSRTTANTATKQFENALDRAWMQINTGGFDANTAIRNAIKDLTDKGIGAVKYPSGHIDTLEVAVRRAVVTGVNQTAIKCQLALAEEMGCDLVETTAHGNARPSHAEWQGKVFSLSGKNKKYRPFRASTGYGSGDGLGGWNCRHSFYPYYEGSQRSYDDKQLKKLDEKKYTYNGKKLTGYEASQKQRQIERTIRKYKREEAAMKEAGLDTAGSEAKRVQWQKKETDFLEQTGLKRQVDRTQVYKSKITNDRKTATSAVKEADSKFDLQKNIAKPDKSSSILNTKAYTFSIDTQKVYENAKNGTRHGGIYKDAINKNDNQLKKSVKSHEEQVVLHKLKIKEPEKYDVDWNNKTRQQQEGLLKKWNKDARRNAEQAAIEKAVLKERNGDA